MLSSKEIKKLLREEELVFSPLLNPEEQVQQGGIDVRLGVGFIVTKHSRAASLDPASMAGTNLQLESYQEYLYVPLGEDLVLHPGETVLGSTLEYIALPPYLAGMVIGRSSWGRHGLTIATALMINPGTKSCITLELINHGRLPINLYPTLRVGKIVLHRISDSEAMTTRYQHAIGPEFPRLHQDSELKFLGRYPTASQVVIGITGFINSDKSRIARKLAERLGFALKSTSREAAHEMEKRGLYPTSAEEIHKLKMMIRKDASNDVFARRALERGLEYNPLGIIIDDICHPSEIAYLRSLPNVRLVTTIANDQYRRERFYLWNKGSVLDGDSAFENADRRTRKGLDLKGEKNPHADKLEACAKQANHLVHTSKGPQQTEKDIEEIVRSMPMSLRDLRQL